MSFIFGLFYWNIWDSNQIPLRYDRSCAPMFFTAVTSFGLFSSIASISIHFFSLGLVMLLFFLLSSIHSYVLFLLFPSFASSFSHYEVFSLACAKCDNTIWALLHNLNGYILSHVQMKKSKLFLHILLFSTLFNSWVIGWMTVTA